MKNKETEKIYKSKNYRKIKKTLKQNTEILNKLKNTNIK